MAAKWTRDDVLVGDRVGTHPATDAWMQGDRYGEIVSVKIDRRSLPVYIESARVKLDKSGRVVTFPAWALQVV